MVTIFQSWGKIRIYLVLLVLVQCCRPTGAAELIGSPGPVIGLAGDDVILPCSLNPPRPVHPPDLVFDWFRHDLPHSYVHRFQDGCDFNVEQIQSYKYRTTLFKGEMMAHGNLSLKLSRVRLEDEGNYTCFIHKPASQQTVIQLIVVAVSQPGISILGGRDGGVVLQCEAEGWFPRPQLEWRDSEGRILSAESEIINEDAGRYTVRSNVTVKKTNNNTICRAHLKTSQVMREQDIIIPDDLFKPAFKAVQVGLRLLGALLLVMSLTCMVFMYRIRIRILGLVKEEFGPHISNQSLKGKLKQTDITIQTLEKELAARQNQLTALKREKMRLEGQLLKQQSQTETQLTQTSSTSPTIPLNTVDFEEKHGSGETWFCHPRERLKTYPS